MHLFTTPDFGLANRLRGLVGAWAHAKHRGQTLDVLWTESDACPYAIQDLFEPLPGTRYIQERDPSGYVYESSDLGHLQDILTKHGLRVALAPLLLASLRPVPALQERLQAIAATSPLAHCLGLHIRRTDLLPYAASLGMGDPNPLSFFWTLCDANPTVPLFVACDSQETLDACRARYGDRVHVAKEMGGHVTGIRATEGDHAVLDLYCLAHCKYFQGSRLSSFTAHVTYLREAWAKSPSLSPFGTRGQEATAT